MIKIIIRKDNFGEDVDVRRRTLKDFLWMISSPKGRKNYFRQVLETLISGVLLCRFGIPTNSKPEYAYSMAIHEARRQCQMGTAKRVSIEFK